MDSIYSFYTETYSRKWGSPYLNRKFFKIILEKFSQNLVLFLAEKDGDTIGGTFNLKKGKNCTEDIGALLHIILFCISNVVIMLPSNTQSRTVSIFLKLEPRESRSF